MPDWLLNLLKSRGFWTGLGPAILAVLSMVGVELGTEQQEALFVLLSIMAGWAGITIVRAGRAEPLSHSDVMDVLARQQRTIDALQELRGIKAGNGK